MKHDTQVARKGRLVMNISEGTFGGKPTSSHHLFRVENGKIDEHWDTIETIQAKSVEKRERQVLILSH